MRFVIDEDMPRSTGKVLQDAGYEVKDIRDFGLRGAADSKIFTFTQDNHAILITGDMGFSNIISFPLGHHLGIIVAHFPNEMSTKEINKQLVVHLFELSAKDIEGNLVILEPGRIRIRKK